MSHPSLEAQIAELKAIEDIRRLKAIYCGLCDRGYDPDKLAQLFTSDAVWDGGNNGRHEGLDAIRKFFSKASSTFPFAAHLVTNPLIEVDGDRATGQWRMLMPCTMRIDGKDVGVMQVAEYDETYKRENGRWLFQSLRVRRRRMSFDGSWEVR